MSRTTVLAKPKLMWLGGPRPPDNVQEALADWDMTSGSLDDVVYAEGLGVALVHPDGDARNPGGFRRLLEKLEPLPLVVILLPRDAAEAWNEIRRRAGRMLALPQDLSPDKLAWVMRAVTGLEPGVSALMEEIGSARQSSARFIEEFDEEMRLAARLQRDFLPKRLPMVGPTRFGVLYRPAGWVSGDIYDIERLDETHLGFYVADAVGHGMPAALLTMFIKKALQTKRIIGNSYQIVPPEVSLAELNTDICQQNLSSCQFCTALYSVLDTETLELTYARAGHPEPMLRRVDGTMENLSTTGSLLGIIPDETYPPRKVQLYPGDRLVVFSDGLEEALRPEDVSRDVTIEEILTPLLDRPHDELLLQLAARIDDRATQGLDDDVTLLVLDIEK